LEALDCGAWIENFGGKTAMKDRLDSFQVGIFGALTVLGEMHYLL
jgi:hypothetical protein